MKITKTDVLVALAFVALMALALGVTRLTW